MLVSFHKYFRPFQNFQNLNNHGRRGMATLKAISQRWKSVKNIQKITKSMKMVSASKYAKAERELRQIRPIGMACLKFYENIQVPPPKPLADTSLAGKFLTVVMCSDRGLCGAVHATIVRRVKIELFRDHEDLIRIICIGEKSKSMLWRTYGKKILYTAREVGKKTANFVDASKLAILILKCQFYAGKIVYNRFKTIVSYTTLEMPLYALGAIQKAPKIDVYDDLDDELVLSYLEFTLVIECLYCMKESATSELSARMTAMENATKNAGDMISKLNLAFNRTRQAVITKELTEIISGAAAVQK